MTTKIWCHVLNRHFRLIDQYQYVLGASLQSPDPAVPGAFTFCPQDAGAAITQWTTDVEGLFDTDQGGTDINKAMIKQRLVVEIERTIYLWPSYR